MSARDETRFNELKSIVPSEFHSNLSVFKADLNREEDCLRLKEEILRKDGQINHVVASIGGWRTDGKLSTVSAVNFQIGLKDLLLPHFNCYKTFSKILSETPKSTYTFITGGTGEAKFVDPTASLLPISAAATYGMRTAAVSEYKNSKNLAIIELRLFFWIRKKLDSNFDPKKSQSEVGHDYVGKFLPKLILKHKADVYKIQSRNIGDELYQKL